MADLFDPIFEIFPKRYAQFSASLFQTGKCVAAPTTGVAAGAATYFTFFYILADGVFSAIIVQRDIRALQNQQQLGFISITSRSFFHPS
jgi:hypothetical protein